MMNVCVCVWMKWNEKNHTRILWRPKTKHTHIHTRTPRQSMSFVIVFFSSMVLTDKNHKETTTIIFEQTIHKWLYDECLNSNEWVSCFVYLLLALHKFTLEKKMQESTGQNTKHKNPLSNGQLNTGWWEIWFLNR